MHSTVGAAKLSIPNRKGRKRKMGRRKTSGDIILARVDFRDMAKLWPVRRDVTDAYRLDERAGTEIGRLNIKWRTSDLPALIRPGISNEEYEAGRQYGNIVNAYLAMAGAPRIACLMATFVSSDMEAMPGCQVRITADDYDERRTERYMRAYEAIRSRQCHMAVNAVTVHDQPCAANQYKALRAGLQDLATHFGLTQHRRAR